MQLGANHVKSLFIEFGQINTVLWFSYILIIVPLVSLFVHGSPNLDYNAWGDLFTTLHHNLPLFMGVVGSILFAALSALANLGNTVFYFLSNIRVYTVITNILRDWINERESYDTELERLFTQLNSSIDRFNRCISYNHLNIVIDAVGNIA